MKKIAILISMITFITAQIDLEELNTVRVEKVQINNIPTINQNQNSISGVGGSIVTGTSTPAKNSVTLTSTITLTSGGSGTVEIWYQVNSSWYTTGVQLTLGSLTGIFENSATISNLTAETTYNWTAALVYVPNNIIAALGTTKSFTTLGNTAPVISTIDDKSMVKNTSLEIELSATDADNDQISFSAYEADVGTINLSFDGINDCLQLPSISNIKSIGFWVYIDSEQDGGDNDHLIDGRPGLDESYLQPNGSGALRPGWDKIYLNGNQIANFNNTSMTRDAWIYVYLIAKTSFTDDLTFMSHHDGRCSNENSSYGSNVYLKGFLEEIAIWDEALTGAEVTALYNSGSGLSAGSNSGDYTSSGNLQGYWKIDEGTGTSISDASGNSNSGTLKGATWSTKPKNSNSISIATSINSKTLTLTPATDWTGTATIIVQASDGTVNSSTSFKLTVIENSTPDIAAVSDVTIKEDETVNVTLIATDLDGDAINYSAISDVSDVVINSSSDVWSSLSFDGIDDYVSIPATTSLTSLTNGFSVNFWVYLPSYQEDKEIISAWGNRGLFYIGMEDGNLNIPLDGGSMGSIIRYSLDGYTSQWLNVAFTFDNTNKKLYFNGTLVASADDAGGPVYDSNTYNGGAIRLGACNSNCGDDFTQLFLDEVAIWNEALTSSEVIALYNAGSRLSAASNSGDYTSSENLQGYWKIDEGTGTSIADASGNGNSGTINGAMWSTDSELTLTPNANWNGVANITAYASDGTSKDSTSIKLTVTPVNDAPIIMTVADDSTNEETEKTIVVSATDIDGDALSYNASSDTSVVSITVSSDTLKLMPATNYTGTAKITVVVSDNALTDTTSFHFKVKNINDSPTISSVSDVTIKEDETGTATLSATDIDGDALTYSAVSDTNAVTVSVSSATLTLTPTANWNGVANIKAYASDGTATDSTSFKLTITPVQDAPTAFEWVSSALDTINITKTNLTDTYTLHWDTSTDAADGDSITYLLYAGTGASPKEEVYDTTSTSLPIPYQEFLENVFEPFPMLPRVTVKFSVSATDGIDTVKVTGDDRVVFVNRYDYLYTESEGIPTEFALHENYPNPFNPTTTLRFDLPKVSDITLTIYNMLGQKVRTFNYQNTSAGYHSVKWNATNDYGDPVGAGVYLYQLQTKDFVKTRKMVLLK